MSNKLPSVSGLMAVILFSMLISASTVRAADPVSQYIINGEPVPKWVGFSGNSVNYFVPLEDGMSKTAKNSLIIKSVEEDGRKALHMKWSGKTVKTEWGSDSTSFFTIGRHKVDLSSVKDVAALAFEIKVIRPPKDQVTLSMRCNYSNKCKGEFPLKQILKRIEKKKWQTLPIPLKCFRKTGNFDYTTITDLFSIETKGKLEIEIRSVQLVAAPKNSNC
ncbi:putative glycoside hydrolase [Paraglaciecola sp.]|uniref:putative glycoside hydrolase n=1 Tax=Paraglaciecola sp. TaxID=1920173 RepID=UPI003EF351BC